jgi:hypothetical protein
VVDEGVHQVFRNVACEGFICNSGVVARRAEYADLVLHLHHQHGVVGRIHLGEVLHQRLEGRRVGLYQRR